MTLPSINSPVLPRYRLVGELVDMRVRPVSRRFDWSALFGTPPAEAVEGTVKWHVIDVSTQEVIATYSRPLHEMVVAASEEDYARTVIESALRRLQTGRDSLRLAG